jgi:hypothetical protein
MNVEAWSGSPRPPAAVGSTWDWDLELAAAIAIVVRYPLSRVVLCGAAATGRTIAKLAPAAASAGVVLEPRLRQGGGWDIEVRAG